MKTIIRFSTFLIFGLPLCITSILHAAAPNNPTGFGATPGNASVTLGWTNPGVFDEIMIVAGTATFVAVPSGDGTAYTANAAFASGTAFGGGYVVYEGTGTSVLVTGLTNGTSYFFKIFARGGTGSAEWSSGVEISSTPLPQPASAGTFPQTCIDSGTISWTNPATVNRILVFAKNNDNGAITVGSPTVASSSYTASSVFGAGDPYENDADAFCVFSSTTGNSIAITGLTPNKTYNFLIFNVDGSAYSTTHTFSGMTRTTVANVSGFSDTPGDSQINLSWTNPTTCFDEMIIVGKLSSLPAITGTPTGDGTAYVGANLNFSTAPAPDFDAASKLLYKGSTSPQTITGLVNGTGYDFKIWVRRGTTWSSGSTTVGTPVDLTPPLVTAFDPADNSTTSVATTSLVITFNEPVNEIDIGASDDTDRIRLFENGIEVLTIDRNDSEITNSGNQITIDISAWPLQANTPYYVLVGNSVIEDDPAGNNFAGIASTTTWNWSTTGTTVTPPADLDICENSPPRALGDIVIEEGGDSDFSTAGSVTLTLNPASGFVFQAGQGNVTFEPIAGNDIASITVNSITFSSITFSYTLDGVNDERDRIRISGLKVSSDGTTPTTNLERTGGTAVMVGNSVLDNKIHATINSGVGPAAPGSITTNPTPFTVCEGASLAGVNVNVGTGTSSLKWYSDASLTVLIGSATGNANPSAAQLGLSSTTPGSYTVYVTQTTTCESAGTPVTFNVNPTPVADAGTDALVFCSDEVITLGGSPTLLSPSVPGPYSYTWTELTGAPITITPAVIPSTPNPQITVTNTSGVLQSLQFMVTISDANGCIGTDTKDLDVRNEVLITLTSPTSTNFSSAGAPQPLAANPTGGVFSGEGVVQTSPTTYSFDPSVAFQNDPTIPRSIPIYYSVTDANGCTVSNKQITSLTLTNNLTFGVVAPQYCSSEYPSGSGVILEADGAAETSVNNRVNSWNSTGRLGYFSNFNPNQSYNVGDMIRYNNEIYRARVFMVYIPGIPPFIPSVNPPAPTVGATDANWEFLNDFMKVTWKGMIRNYYEGYYGGNNGSPTIIKLGSTYTSTVGAGTLNQYGMRTNPDYINCSTCNYLYPATYVEFINPAHIIEILPNYFPGGYYGVGNIVKSGGSVYRALLAGNIPAPPNATYWQNVTNSNWDNGNYFHVNDGGFRSGFYHNGQFVTVNKNPTVSFSGLNSGLPNADDFCNASASFVLSGSVPSAGNFSMNFNGGSFGTLPGLTNNLPTVGRATFDPGSAYTAAGGSGIKTFGVKYSFDPGTVGSTSQACTGEEVQFIDIHPLPSITYVAPTPATSSVFCYAETPVNLAASETINVQYSGLGVTNVAGGTGKFNPNQAYTQREVELGSTQTTPQSFNVVVTYQNVIGCTNTDTRTYEVRPLPPAVFTYGPKKDFCYAEADIPFQSANTSGRYEIFYVRAPANPDISIVTHGTKDYSFDPSDMLDLAVANGADPLSTPTFRVVFTTNDPVKTTCTNTQVELFTVAPQIPASIAGVLDLEVYCANEGTRVLTMNPPFGTFRLNGNIQTLIGGTTFELNQEPNGGDFELSYVVSTGTGCNTSIIKNIKILPSPIAQFNISPKCDGDVIDFVSQNNVNADQVTWNFGDDNSVSGPVGSFGSTTHQYATNSINNAVLTLSAAEHVPSGITCTSIAMQDVIVGALPISDFSVSKVCEDENTEFIATTTNGVNLAMVSWDFGDGDLVPEGNTSLNIIPAHSNGGRTTGTYGNPIHKYVTSGSYPVQMLGRTSSGQGGCPDDQNREVSILTNVTPTPDAPYFMKSLNGENGLWVPEDQDGNSTWAFGPPNGTTINSTELAWATNPSGVYLENDQSFMNSPCFDMSAFERPVIAISHWADTHSDDGAVLQYSVNGGQSWLAVGGFIGDIATGLDWFNAQGLASVPGGQSNVAWARTNQTNWLEGKHSLDFIPVSQRNQVRFRVAFASRQRSPITRDGFAFNEVKIEERNRTILVENFTNNTVSNAQANNQSFLTFRDGSSTAELVKLQYHIGLPTADNINKQNPADLNARAAFYGLTNSASLVPKGYMDGASQGNFLSNWVDSYFSLRSLVSSPLKIQVTTLPTDLDKFSVETTIEATSDITTGRLSLFIAVIEKTVGNEGFVVRKILPSAAGTELQLPMVTGSIVTVSPTPWEVINAVNPQELAVVAFVQDIETHDVLQATLLQNPANLPTQITGLENESVITDQISFFPNPVDHELTIQLPYPSRQEVMVKLADPVGKIVYDNSIPAGEKSKTINTRNLPGGIYLLQIENGKGNVAYRKVMIVHNK
ncbi:MAG: Ig-like domain-containing protein [Cyclobacteriaceae bacterium]